MSDSTEQSHREQQPADELGLKIITAVVAGISTLAVAAAGFALSFAAMTEVGVAARIARDMAWLMPISVDGAIAAATVTAVALRRLRPDATGAYRYAGSVVLAGALISVACNGVHALGVETLPAVVLFLVSAIPAVMLTLTVHLAVVLVDTLTRRTAAAVVELVDAEPVAEPELAAQPLAAPAAGPGLVGLARVADVHPLPIGDRDQAVRAAAEAWLAQGCGDGPATLAELAERHGVLALSTSPDAARSAVRREVQRLNREHPRPALTAVR